MRRTMLFVLAATALVACKPEVTESNDTDSDGVIDDQETGQDTDDGRKDDGMSPWVESGDVTCYTTGGSSDVMTWWMKVVGNDPQGTENLKRSFSDVIIKNQVGGVVWQGPAIVCNPDTGECEGSVREADTGALCAQATNFTFQVVLYDKDGNTSNPSTLEYYPTSG